MTMIAICDMMIADGNMRLGEKIRYLREVEGALRGLDREMSQQEVVRAIRKELRKSISQSYISQIESGARPHLSNGTRLLLARFFKVHPGYLVDDPEGFQNGLISDLGASEDQLDLWLIEGAVVTTFMSANLDLSSWEVNSPSRIASEREPILTSVAP